MATSKARQTHATPPNADQGFVEPPTVFVTAKASLAFRTISEVSLELDVPKHVLRFWEGRFPQLKPMKRGGGRRFYRPEDVELLRGIRHLLHGAGYTIRGVQKILRESGVEAIKRAGAPGAVVTPMAQEDAGRSVNRRLKPRVAGQSAPMAHALATIVRELEACLALAEGRAVPAVAVPTVSTQRRRTP